MRVMFTTTGSAGHLGPILPFADAVRHAGGEVLIATRESSAEQARATGFDVWAFPDASPTLRRATMEALRELPGPQANARMAEDVFGGMDADAALPGVLAACRQWRPDVVVSEPSEFAGRVAGPHLGLPTVLVGITQYALEHHLRPHTDNSLRRLRREHGLRGGAEVARFTLFPPLLEDPAFPGPPHGERFREPDATTAPLRGLLERRQRSARVPDVRLGGPAARRSVPRPVLGGDRRARLVAGAPARHDRARSRSRAARSGARERPRRALGAAGERHAARARAGQPRRERDASRGLAAGIPQVVLPLFADQPTTPDASRRSAPASRSTTSAGLADAVRSASRIPLCGAAATVAADIEALPPVEHAAARLRELREVREADIGSCAPRP